MRLLVGICVGLLVGWSAVVLPVFGQEQEGVGEWEQPGITATRRSPVNIALGADLMTRYVARGVSYSTGPVTKSWMTATCLPYYMEIKGIYYVERGKFEEIDFTLDYSMNLRSWLVAIGYNFYTFPNTDFPEMNEGYVNIVAPTFLNPAAKLYYSRWRGVDSFIMKLTLAHTFDFEHSALALSAITIYRDDKSFVGTEFRVDVPIPMKQFTLLPTIRYSLSVKDEIADTLYGGMILRFVF